MKVTPRPDDVGAFGKVVYVVRGWLYMLGTCCDVELIW